MAIEETATDISQWSSTAANNYPTGDGKRGNADDEHRYTKKLIKDKFGAFTGSVNVTATEAELNYTAVTPGTATASKALVLDALKDASGVNDLGVSGTLTATTCVLTNVTINGSSLTSTGTELNQLAGLTPGTVTLSKAIVVDASKDISGFNDVGISGTLTVGTSTFELNGIELGDQATGDRYAFVDLVGDDTYTDYGFRIIRGDTGANATSTVYHHGTGDFRLIAQEAAAITFATDTTTRLTINSTGFATFTELVTGPATDPTADNHLARKAYVDSVGVASFTSSTLSIPAAGGTAVAAPGLTDTPIMWQFFLRCTDAGGDAGYDQNEEVPVSEFTDAAGSAICAFSTRYDPAYLGSNHGFHIVRGDDASSIYINHTSTGADTAITTSKWRAIVRAVQMV